jgi:hypothetical protein
LTGLETGQAIIGMIEPEHHDFRKPPVALPQFDVAACTSLLVRAQQGSGHDFVFSVLGHVSVSWSWKR